MCSFILNQNLNEMGACVLLLISGSRETVCTSVHVVHVHRVPIKARKAPNANTVLQTPFNMATHTVGIIVLALHCMSGSHGQGLAPPAYSIVASPGSCPYTQQSWECRPGQPGPRLYNQ